MAVGDPYSASLDRCSYILCTTAVAGVRWRVAGFEWDEANGGHVARHGVEETEVEEVFRGRLYVRKVRDTYTVLGLTATGRRLFVVVAKKEHGVVRPITARDMMEPERKLYKREVR